MTPLQTNKPVFFDGYTPLNGTIYVGQPGTDPRSNPKTVTFEDSGGSQFPAEQPLPVLNGKIVYNGKPILALVDGAYSALLLDMGDRQVDYIRSFDPSVGGASGADFSEVTRVGLTLDEIKAFDVAVGDVVRNIGKVLATDWESSDWLAVSPTGSPADDLTLIDFTNGLQGQFIDSVVYKRNFDPALVATEIKDGSFSPSSPTQVWTGSTSGGVAMGSLSESGTGWYIIKDNTGDAYQIYVLDLATDAIGSSAFFSGTIARQAYFRLTDDKFFLFEYNSDTGAFISNVVITAIYKV